jgi:hypothetical protein
MSRAESQAAYEIPIRGLMRAVGFKFGVQLKIHCGVGDPMRHLDAALAAIDEDALSLKDEEHVRR